MARNVVEFFRNLLATSGLSKYETFGTVDEGRMSVIYRARDKKTMRTCFLKIYKADCIRIRSAIRRKQPGIDEALLELDHPHVMKIYEFGRTKSGEYQAMEAIDGPALGTLAREGKLSLPDALSVFEQVAEGLAYLHEEAGMFHRDVNPFNVVVAAGREAKIIDLDFALLERPDTRGMYRRSGTVAYLSPEQVRGRHLDHRVDLYALGVTMYEVLTQVNPYWDQESEEQELRIDRTNYNHLVLIPNAPSTLNSEIPPDLDDLILSCLRIDKEERVQSAAEVRDRLREISSRPD